MDSSQEIIAFAPATVANVGPGFDVLGFALESPGDTVTVRRIREREVRIAEIEGDDGALSTDVRRNTAGMAAFAAWEAAKPDFGIELRIKKSMPLGSGMGSSAASAVAAAVATARVLGASFSDAEMLRFCAEGEMVASGDAIHYDNIAASLFGGLIRVRDTASADIERIAPLPSWHVALIHPDIVVRTKDARAAIPPDVMTTAVLRLAPSVEEFLAAVRAADIARAGVALMHDDIITPLRATFIRGYADVIAAALAGGATGASISGSGPAMFALADSEAAAEKAGEAMQQAFAANGIGSRIYRSAFGAQGARVV